MKDVFSIFVLTYLSIINVAGFMSMVIDKRRAVKGLWRISEKTLLIIAFIGGALGSYIGMQLFRHKTKHWKFIILVPLALIIHIIITIKFL